MTVCHHKRKTPGTCSRVGAFSCHPLPFKRPSPGMCPNWNCLDKCVTVANLGWQRCWFQKTFAQYGSLKRDVQQFSSAPPWSWQYMLQTQVEVWRCTRLASRASLKYFGKDVGEEPKTSTLQGDLNVELGLVRTDEKDIEELTEEMYGPLCWQWYYDNDPGGFKKNHVECGIMKEFNLQGHVHVVHVRKGKEKTAFTAQTFEPRKGRRDIAAGQHYRTKEKK